jgi:hypothetical protein
MPYWAQPRLSAELGQPVGLGRHDGRQAKRHGARARRHERDHEAQDAAGGHVRGQREVRFAQRLAIQIVDHHDVHRRMVDLHDVKGTLNNERAGRNLGIRVARRRHPAAMNLEARRALEATVDGRSRRARYLEQPTPRRDFLYQVDDAYRPGLLAQRVDGLLNALLLLGRKARGQRLPSACATRNSGGLVDLSKT